MTPWYEEQEAPDTRRAPKQEFLDPSDGALASPKELVGRIVAAAPLWRWAVALLAALVAGTAAFVVTRPGPPTRDEVVAAIIDAAERQDRPMTVVQAGCVVDELEAERIDYAEVMATSEPSAELRRVFDNAFLRCTSS
jgi:hypothetical protein